MGGEYFLKLFFTYCALKSDKLKSHPTAIHLQINIGEACNRYSTSAFEKISRPRLRGRYLFFEVFKRVHPLRH